MDDDGEASVQNFDYSYDEFTHAGTTIRYQMESLYCIKVFLCCQGHAINSF